MEGIEPPFASIAPVAKTTMIAEEEGKKTEPSLPTTVTSNGFSSVFSPLASVSQPQPMPMPMPMPETTASLAQIQALLGQDPNANAIVTSILTAAVQSIQHQQAQQAQQQQWLQQQMAALAPYTHNLIPIHLQNSAWGATLNGTPGYSPALIPPPLATLSPQLPFSLAQCNQQQLQQIALAVQNNPQFALPTIAVQDLPQATPVYNGVNPNYPGLRVLNSSPPVFAVDNFLSPLECQFLVTVASDSFGPAPVVGKGAGEVSASRTSSTCYLSREDLPDLMRKVSVLTGKPIEHCELPQVGRYLPSQQYLQHFDAFDTSNEDGRRFAANGGQRTVTVLIYLNDVLRGGATRFPALNLDVQPRQGMALVFFPATVDGYLDKMALHAALPAVDTKYVSQVWIRQTTYNGQPSKRLSQIMGAPLPPLGSVQVAQATPTANPNMIINPLAASSTF